MFRGSRLLLVLPLFSTATAASSPQDPSDQLQWNSLQRQQQQQPLFDDLDMAATNGFPSLQLNDGRTIPVVAYGLGTANSKKGSKDLNQDLIDITVKAIKAGFTHLDGAELILPLPPPSSAYGNEAELGAAVRASGVAREKLFVTTKATARADRPLEDNLAASLRRLGLDYVDLYLIHSPFFTDDPAVLQAKWAEMEAIRASGRARSVGVSNFVRQHLDPVLETARVPPAINQVEFHPYLQHVTRDGSEDLRAYHRDKGIALSGYAGLTAVTRPAPGPVDDEYAALAARYNVTEGDVALRWTLDLGLVAITTSSREDRLKHYLETLPAFHLTAEETDRISELGMKKHYRGFWAKQFDDDDWR